LKTIKSDAIYDDLKYRIYSGEFNGTTRLPSETELSAFYACSRPTLRKALEVLVADGLVVQRQGAGSFLTEMGISISQATEIPSIKTSLFGIVFPGLGVNYVFDIICNEVTRILAQSNCSLVWGGTVMPNSPTLMDEVRKICAKYVELQVDGVFFSPIEYSPLSTSVNEYILDTFSQAQIPVVLIDSDVVEFPKQSHHDLVSLDHVQASYVITKHMIEQNIRQIHFLSPPMSAKTIKLRQIGFREALFDCGLAVDSQIFHQADPRDPIAVRSIVSSGAQGILCSNDGTAITLLDTLRRLEVAVPRDLVVAGFDNLSYLSQIRTPLTSISQPTELISQEAVRLMLARVKHPHRPFRTVRFPGTLIVRRSTRFGSESD